MIKIEHMAGGVAALGLLVLAPLAQAQLDCGAGAASGTDTVCNTDGLTETNLYGAISLYAPDDGTTTFTSTVGQSVSSPLIRNLTGSGGGDIELNVGGHLSRAMDFSAHTGDLQVTVQAAGTQAGGFGLGASQFGSGDATVRVEAGALMTLHDGYPNNFSDTPFTLEVDFGGGDNALINQGAITIGDARIPDAPTLVDNGTGKAYAREITLSNLDRFDNEGELIMGGVITQPSFLLSSWVADSRQLPATDTVARTALFMPGTAFVGGPGSVVRLDAVFRYGTAQVNCRDRVLRQAAAPMVPDGSPWGSPSLMAADCIDLSGGSTSGVTELVIYDEQPGALAANFGDEEILLISVEGGDSAAEHFVLSPQSEHYDARTGTLQQGFFQFPLIYDAETQQHRLIGLPGSRALALPHVLQSVQTVARTVGREALGDDWETMEATGMWVRLGSQRQSREARRRFDRYNVSVGVSSDHDIDTTSLTVGRSWRAGDWLLGGSLSYVDAGLSFDQNEMAAEMGGAGLGAHARYRSGALFVDNLVQLQWLEMDLSDPGFAPPRRGSKKFGYSFLTGSTAYRDVAGHAGTQTLHLRSELGWRLAPAAGIELVPLLGASWVRSEVDEMTIQSYDRAAADNRFFGDSADSLRATVGVRASLESPGEGLRLRYTGSVRHWLSVKDETKVRVANAGPDLVVEDDFEGGWTELTAGVGLSSESGRISGELQAYGVFGAYEGFGVTAGLQLRW